MGVLQVNLLVKAHENCPHIPSSSLGVIKKKLQATFSRLQNVFVMVL